MRKFSRYLDAAKFARKHNISLAAIQKTGWYEWTVFVADDYIVSNNGRPFPVPFGDARGGTDA